MKTTLGILNGIFIAHVRNCGIREAPLQTYGTACGGYFGKAAHGWLAPRITRLQQRL